MTQIPFILGWVLYVVASLYLLVMFARMILDWVQFLVSSFRPRGVFLILANIVYALTDPPIRALRKVIPPVRVGGGVSIDMGFMIVFLALIIAQRIALFMQSFS